MATRDFCFALAGLVGPVQNIFFPHRTPFQLQFFVPIAQQARQAAVLVCLSLSVCVSRIMKMSLGLKCVLSDRGGKGKGHNPVYEYRG
jgi:hypothetical protein